MSLPPAQAAAFVPHGPHGGHATHHGGNHHGAPRSHSLPHGVPPYRPDPGAPPPPPHSAPEDESTGPRSLAALVLVLVLLDLLPSAVHQLAGHDGYTLPEVAAIITGGGALLTFLGILLVPVLGDTLLWAVSRRQDAWDRRIVGAIRRRRADVTETFDHWYAGNIARGIETAELAHATAARMDAAERTYDTVAAAVDAMRQSSAAMERANDRLVLQVGHLAEAVERLGVEQAQNRDQMSQARAELSAMRETVRQAYEGPERREAARWGRRVEDGGHG